MNELSISFSSRLASYMVDFIEYKRGLGYKYVRDVRRLALLDRFLVEKKHFARSLPRHLVDQWIKRRDAESPRNQENRMSLIRVFAKYLILRGVHAYYPPRNSIRIATSNFVPYIFSHEEIRLLFDSADLLSKFKTTLWYTQSFPIVLRLLYSTGLRLGEAVRLRWCDVDLDKGVLGIYQSKFRKCRFVPVSSQMRDTLKSLAKTKSNLISNALVFPSPHGKLALPGEYYKCFRNTLAYAGISHGGRGKGPRVHDLRHTFAVHNLEKWLKSKDDLSVKLPVLVDYLGHETLQATQKYLRLIPTIHSEIVQRMENSIGKLIKGYKNETD